MTADSFEKAKKGMKDTAKGLKDTAKGVEDTAGGVHETAGGVNETAGGVIEGIQDTAERVIEGVKDTVKGVKEGVEETAEGVKDTAEEVDADTYTGSDDERENREYNESGSKEPMNPEGIAEHEPTAVKRDQGTDIADEGQTGTDSPEAREKFKKSGMTNTK
jgi:coenzyme F420-reducing hydrogenase alpha subunit